MLVMALALGRSSGTSSAAFVVHSAMDVVEAYFQEFDCHEWWQFSQTQWGVPIGCAMAYLVFVFAGPMVMKLLPDWKLKHTLALWNFLLAAFSILGFTVLRALRVVHPAETPPSLLREQPLVTIAEGVGSAFFGILLLPSQGKRRGYLFMKLVSSLEHGPIAASPFCS